MPSSTTRAVLGIVLVLFILILTPFILSMFTSGAEYVNDAFNGSLVVGQIGNDTIQIELGPLLAAIFIVAGVAVILIGIIKAFGD